MPSENIEWCQLVQLLKVLEKSDGFELPICVDRRDKPDFELATSLRKRIGLETTLFTDEEVIRADLLHHTRFPNACVSMTGLRDGASRRSNDEISQMMLTIGANWDAEGDVVDHAARKIFGSIQLKRQKFLSPDFTKFDENWLLLTDYSNPFVNSITFQFLKETLSASPGAFGTEFDRVYVLFGPCCFRYDEGKLSAKLDPRLA
jgi:hypothetical protein